LVQGNTTRDIPLLHTLSSGEVLIPLYDRGKQDHTLGFGFDEKGRLFLREKKDQFVAEVNEAIRKGEMPPKSKIPKLVQRIACTLHVFNHTMEELLASVPSTQTLTAIASSTLEKAACESSGVAEANTVR